MIQFDEDLIGEEPMSTLDPVEEDFCQQYVANGVAWTAYRDTVAKHRGQTGNPDTLRKSASQFTHKPHIKARVDQIKRQVYQAAEVSPGRIIHEYAKLAFFDIRNVFDQKGNLKPVHQMDDATAAGIAGLEISVDDVTRKQDIYNEDSDDIGRVDETKTTTRTAKLKLIDKTKALDSLAKIMGMHVERVEHTGADGAPLIPDNSEIETARRVAFLLSQGIVQQEAR